MEEFAVQRLMHGLVVWAFSADTDIGDPCRIQYCRSQWIKMWEHKDEEAVVLNQGNPQPLVCRSSGLV